MTYQIFQADWPVFAVAAVLAYLTGAIPSGLLISRACGVDIRKAGSGNIGATNVMRCVGKTAGRLCFFCDFIKGLLPTAGVLCLVGGKNQALVALAAAMMTIIGHMFPVFLKFKGGKGISTAAGAGLALAPYPLLIALAGWVIIFKVSRYVSLASIAAAVILPSMAVLFARLGIGSEVAQAPSTQIFFIVVGILATVKHRDNIQRLLAGTENRFERKKR